MFYSLLAISLTDVQKWIKVLKRSLESVVQAHPVYPALSGIELDKPQTVSQWNDRQLDEALSSYQKDSNFRAGARVKKNPNNSD